MRIYSYNVNGIRAALTKGLADWVAQEKPDVLCLQETKAQPEQIDQALFERLGYHGYYYSAEKKGYSGVAVLCKQQPKQVTYGLGIPEYDAEGRAIRVDFDQVSILCVYIPSGTSGEVRQAFKMEFLSRFADYVAELRKTCPNLLVCGDYNIAHEERDINHPERQIGVSGFLPEEREWLTGFLATGMIDTFREYDPRGEQYSWWSYRGGARSRNAGWRIDYLLAAEPLRRHLKAGGICQQAVHSDHCPVFVELDINA